MRSITGLAFGKPLGEGTYSKVTAVPRGGVIVAVKISVPNLWHHLAKEIVILRSLSHPNIIKVDEVLLEGDNLGYTMKKYDSNLSRRLHERTTSDDGLLEMFRQVCSAVCYCHSAGVIHCDIKPDNILCSGTRAILCDFGIARVTSKNTGLVQSSLYRAPEVVMGMAWGSAVDVWSLGILLYVIRGSKISIPMATDTECPLMIYAALFGSPFCSEQASIKKRMDETFGKHRVTNIISRCLCFDPEERPTVYTVYDDLLKVTTGEIELAPRTFGGNGQRKYDNPILCRFMTECIWNAEGLPEDPPVKVADLYPLLGSQVSVSNYLASKVASFVG